MRGKGTTTERGYGWQHQKWAKAILTRDPVCVCDGYPGCSHEPEQCMQAAREADHIDGDTFNRSMSNGQGLCIGCHTCKTNLSKTNKPSSACNADGIPIDRRHHWS